MDKKLFQRRRFLTYAGLASLGLGSAAIAIQSSPRSSTSISSDSFTSAKGSPVLNQDNPEVSKADKIANKAASQKLPEFRGISQWLNSEPLSVESLQGYVVMIQFWTFGCINCQRTLLYVTQWHEKYASQGLRVIGVHTPEFAYERDVNNIRNAMQKYGINYAVALDNEFQTWRAYNNEYWPHLFLADRQGSLQYDHIGEGAYAKTEQIIQQLLG